MGILDSINTYIKRLEALKANELEAFSNAEEKANNLYYNKYLPILASYNKIEKTIAEIKRQAEEVEREMQYALYEAKKHGASPTEISRIEQYYNNILTSYNFQLEKLTNESTDIGGKLEIERENCKQANAEKNNLNSEIISTCHTLTGEYLTKGRYEQQELVNSYITKPIDYMG